MSDVSTIRIPVWPLIAVTVGLAVSAWLAASNDDLRLSWAGLLLSMVLFGLVLAHRRMAVVAMDDPRFERVRVVPWLMIVLLVVVLLQFPLHAWPIAWELAER